MLLGGIHIEIKQFSIQESMMNAITYQHEPYMCQALLLDPEEIKKC